MYEENTSEVMNLVFQYLKSSDLAIAAQVSSSWDRIAKHESIERSTYFFMLDMILENLLSKWGLRNLRVKPNFSLKPSFGMRFYNANIDVNISHGNNYTNKEFCGFIINIKTNYNLEVLKNKKFLYWFAFPLNMILDIKIFSYINRHIANKNNCRSICFDTDDIDKVTLFLNNLNTFFSEENVRSKVLIIFCRTASLKKLLKVFNYLDKWIGEIDIIFWLVLVDELSICRYNFDLHDCGIDTEFIFTFLTDPLLTAYSSYISNEYYTAEKIRSELIMFKEEIKLSRNSIAFMHISYERIERELYELDISMFKEVFPNVDLYPLYGTGSFVCCCFASLLLKSRLPFSEFIERNTTILLLSYN